MTDILILGREGPDGREFLTGFALEEDGSWALDVSPILFDAHRFATRSDAEECIRRLGEIGVKGFDISEVEFAAVGDAIWSPGRR